LLLRAHWLGSVSQIGVGAETTLPALHAAGDAVRALADLHGRLITCPYNFRADINHNHITLTTTTETTLIAAGGAGIFFDLIHLQIAQIGGGAPCTCDIRDATTGTIRYSFRTTPDISYSATFTVPLTQSSGNNNWTAQLGTGVLHVLLQLLAFDLCKLISIIII